MYRAQCRRVPSYSALATLFVLIGALGACTPKGVSDAAEAREVFEKYRRAVLAQDGEAAAECVGSSTFDIYESWRDLALNASLQQLQRENVMNMFVVVRLRSLYDRSEIEAISPRDLFVIGVEKGWVSRSSVENVEIASLEFDGDRGKLFVAKGSDVHFAVEREDGEWKLDLGPVMEMAGPLMDAQAEDAEMTKRVFVEYLYLSVSEDPLDPEVWKGPRESD